MNLFFRLIIITVITFFIFSCKPNRLKVDIRNSKTDVEFVRFDNELFLLPLMNATNEFKTLHDKYSGFFNLFTYRIIRIGGLNDSVFTELMVQFLKDTMILDVRKKVENEFRDIKNVTSEINTAFKHYQYYYPGKKLPVVYLYVSGFNQSVVTAENIVGVSLDKYLGTNCNYYKKLSTTPDYKIKNMHRKKITSDVMYAWGMSEFEYANKATNLLGNMIHHGKLMYFTDAMLPEMHDTLKIGYSKKQLNWCKKNEGEIWRFLVEQKMLYSNQRMDIVRYINDGPTTSSFPSESPGRAGVWLGWQIVRQYMEKHPEITLDQLMKNTEYQEILNASGYFPE